jgi:hypothetical protein
MEQVGPRPLVITPHDLETLNAQQGTRNRFRDMIRETGRGGADGMLRHDVHGCAVLRLSSLNSELSGPWTAGNGAFSRCTPFPFAEGG